MLILVQLAGSLELGDDIDQTIRRTLREKGPPKSRPMIHWVDLPGTD